MSDLSLRCFFYTWHLRTLKCACGTAEDGGLICSHISVIFRLGGPNITWQAIVLGNVHVSAILSQKHVQDIDYCPGVWIFDFASKQTKSDQMSPTLVQRSYYHAILDWYSCNCNLWSPSHCTCTVPVSISQRKYTKSSKTVQGDIWWYFTYTCRRSYSPDNWHHTF